MTPTPTLDELAAAVQASPKYAPIYPPLVRRLTAVELAKGRSAKETVKAVRNKLHQIGGAYLQGNLDWAGWTARLNSLPADLTDPDLQGFLRQVMSQHASTAERLPILEDFFHRTLADIAPVHSVLDLASGLNPLCLPWIPLAPAAPYFACDIYADQSAFLNAFFARLHPSGHSFQCDLTAETPGQPVHLALILKTIPCLEQVDKSIGTRLLDSIPAENLLVSFPAHSLGGRSKGMVENYAARFEQLTAGRGWQITRFEFSTELAFLVKR